MVDGRKVSGTVIRVDASTEKLLRDWMHQLNAETCALGYFSREQKKVIPVISVYKDDYSPKSTGLGSIDVGESRYHTLKKGRAILEHAYLNDSMCRLIIPLCIEDYHYGLAIAVIKNRDISQSMIAKSQERFRVHAFNIMRQAIDMSIEHKNIGAMTPVDHLTGLSTRKNIRKILTDMCRKGSKGLLLLVDLDNFKIINYTHGHDAGDGILVEIGDALVAELPRSSVIARFGDDEFLVLLMGNYIKKEKHICECVSEVVKFNTPKWVKSKITASIGCVNITLGSKAEELLNIAVECSVEAKRAGRNAFYIYKEGHQELPTISRALRIIDEDNIYYKYQPIFSSNDHSEVLYYESLARIKGIESNLSLPLFLKILEETDYITILDVYAMRESIKTIGEFRDKYQINLRIGVNVSGRTIGSHDFLSEVEVAIKEKGINPYSLVFEITETAAIKCKKQATRFITKLRAIGCSVALDDFGSGNLSYEHLISNPIDVVKIDGELVKKALTSEFHYAIAENIANTVKHKKAICIAEGVETKPVLDALSKIELDGYQGYYFARPLNLRECIDTKMAVKGTVVEAVIE